MKHFLSVIAAAILATVFIASCKKDDDKDSNPSKTPVELISGKWTFVSVNSSKPSSFAVDMATGTGLFQDKESACAKSSTLNFTKTGENNGTLLVFDNCAQSNLDNTWILQNNVLTTQAMDYNVAQLDNSALHLYRKGGRTGAVDPAKPGEYTWTDYTDTLVFKRN